jgi:hypothetical protein
VRSRHPKPAVEAAVQELEDAGWRVVSGSGHAWGKAYCPQADRTGCIVVIWSTPRTPEAHADQIRRKLRKCTHDGSTLF